MIFLSLHPISDIDFIPIMAMEPNKMTIEPPITASGMVNKKLAIGGKKLAMTKNAAPKKIVKRFVTLVCETIPTF